MEPADLEGCWTSREHDYFLHDTLWLLGPDTSTHPRAELCSRLGELCSLSNYQGGDCGGTTHSFSGSWALDGDVLTMRMRKETHAESGSAGHRNYETTEPCDLTVTAKVVREGGKAAILLEWNGEKLTLVRRAT